jgi:AcrR family transcriptional regulator
MAGMAAPRPRNAKETRADILTAARARFAKDGYDRTTLRAVAADVGVDAAMVVRYFGSKQELFASAADTRLNFPDLSAVSPDEVADVLLPHFFAVWEHDGTFLALLRAATTSPAAADRMRQVFAAQVVPTLSVMAPDHPLQRANLLGAFVLGLAISRYILATPGLAIMDRAEITRWAAPVMRQILTGPAPAA